MNGERAEPRRGPGAANRPGSEELLRFEGVVAGGSRWGRLDAFNLTLSRGEVVALLGHARSGISMALRLAATLETPERGRVDVLGVDAMASSRFARLRLRARVALVEEEPVFLNNVRMGDNLALPLRYHTRRSEGEVRAAVRERMRDVGIDEWEDGLPARFDRVFRKKAALARALSLDPEILLLDHPESGLPGHHAGFLRPLLGRIREKRIGSVLLATESPRFAVTHASRLLLLREGRTLYDGDPTKLRREEAPVEKALDQAWKSLAGQDPLGTGGEVLP